MHATGCAGPSRVETAVNEARRRLRGAPFRARGSKRAVSTPSGMRRASTPRSRSADHGVRWPRSRPPLDTSTSASRQRRPGPAAAVVDVRQSCSSPPARTRACFARQSPAIQATKPAERNRIAPGRRAGAGVPRPAGSVRASRRRPLRERARRCEWWRPRAARCRAAFLAQREHVYLVARASRSMSARNAGMTRTSPERSHLPEAQRQFS